MNLENLNNLPGLPLNPSSEQIVARQKQLEVFKTEIEQYSERLRIEFLLLRNLCRHPKTTGNSHNGEWCLDCGQTWP